MSKKKRKVVFKKGEGDIRPLNLLNVERVVQSNTQFLERVFDVFTRDLGRIFLRQFKKNITTSMVSQKVCKLDQFFKSFKNSIFLSIFKINKEIERGFISFENQVVFELLTLGYGGKESNLKESLDKEITQVELIFMKEIVGKILLKLGHSFASLWTMDFVLEKNEINPNFFPSSTDVVIIFTFEVNFEKTTGGFNIALPFNLVEKLRRKV
ncbi:MAG: hypothetical protein VYD54_11465 [Bdellovibrionota bacterium]|nr:hypothetical protein [Bdellovibrionota bacterium]